MPDRANKTASDKGWQERLAASLVAFVRFPIAEKLLLPLAWLLLGMASIAVTLLPFRLISPLLGKQVKASHVPVGLDRAHARRAQWVRNAINRAARLMPLRSDCLPQAFAASLLCRLLRMPSSAHIGVRHDGSTTGMAAHAWVLVGDFWVSGGLSIPEYELLTSFRRP